MGTISRSNLKKSLSLISVKFGGLFFLVKFISVKRFTVRMCWTSYTDDGQVDEYRTRLTTEAYMVYFGVDLSIHGACDEQRALFLYRSFAGSWERLHWVLKPERTRTRERGHWSLCLCITCHRAALTDCQWIKSVVREIESFYVIIEPRNALLPFLPIHICYCYVTHFV